MAFTVTPISEGQTLTTTTATIYTVPSSATATYADIALGQLANSSAAAAAVVVSWVKSTGTIVNLTQGKSIDANSSISFLSGLLTLTPSSRVIALCETTAASVDITISGKQILDS